MPGRWNEWSRLHRFLILGVDGPTYYATEHQLVKENAEAVLRCIVLDGKRTVDEIVAVRFPDATRSSSRWCSLLPRVPPPKTLTRAPTRWTRSQRSVVPYAVREIHAGSARKNHAFGHDLHCAEADGRPPRRASSMN
jgi:hypothetical protein